MSGRFLPAAAISSEARKSCKTGAEQRQRDRLRYKAGHYRSRDSQDLTLRLAKRELGHDADQVYIARCLELRKCPWHREAGKECVVSRGSCHQASDDVLKVRVAREGG